MEALITFWLFFKQAYSFITQSKRHQLTPFSGFSMIANVLVKPSVVNIVENEKYECSRMEKVKKI